MLPKLLITAKAKVQNYKIEQNWMKLSFNIKVVVATALQSKKFYETNPWIQFSDTTHPLLATWGQYYKTFLSAMYKFS